MKILVLFTLFTNLFVTSQNLDSIKISNIDSICSSINSTNTTDIKTIQSSGLIKKKKFFFFNKVIGSFHQDAYHTDKNIFKITYFEKRDKQIKNETYYYSNNKLIKYEFKTYNKKQLSVDEKIINAYFYDGTLIKLHNNSSFKFDETELLEKATELYKRFTEYLQISK